MATLAWTIYSEQRTRHSQPGHGTGLQPEVIARQVRITLRDADIQLPPGTDRITEIIATEITRHATPPARLAIAHCVPAKNPDSRQESGSASNPGAEARRRNG
jgi:hypothetical protein